MSVDLDIFNHAVDDRFQEVEVGVSDWRQMARVSVEVFIELYLSEEIHPDDDIQDFHILVFKRFVDLTTRKDVIALPRGHAKTTYLRLAFIYLIYYSPLQFLIYLSATHTAAAASLQVVWDYLSSPETDQIYGCPRLITKAAPGEGWYEFTVDWYDANDEPRPKKVILRALGQGQTLRGMNLRKLRPQFAGVDDIEDETAVKTKEGYQKLKTWFDNTFMCAMARPVHKVAQIGNLIGQETLLNDNLLDPDWRSMRLGVLRNDGNSLWPFLWPLSEIRSDFETAVRRGQSGEWMGEMMNLPYNIENGLITPDKITYTPRRHYAETRKDHLDRVVPVYRSFITIDPAISERDSSDDAAIVLHTLDHMGVGQQSEVFYERTMTPECMSDIVYELCTKWDCWVVGVESVAFQKVLLHYFRLVFKLNGRDGMDFVPIDVGRSHKTARLKAYTALLATGATALPYGDVDITAQLLSYDVRKANNRDDIIDACSMYQYMLDNHLNEITKSRADRIAGNDHPIIPASTGV